MNEIIKKNINEILDMSNDLYHDKINLARILMSNDDDENAIEMLNPIFEQNTDIKSKIVAARLLGTIYGTVGYDYYSPKSAAKYFQYTVGEMKDFEATYIYAEYLLFGTGYLKKDFKNAEIYVDRLINAGYIDAYHLKGCLYIMAYEKTEGNKNLAVICFNKGVANGNPNSYYELGLYWLNKGEYAEAVDNFIKCRKMAIKKDDQKLVNKARIKIKAYERLVPKRG